MTIQDVSKYTKLSVATISRVINNDCRVAQKTKKRVEEAMQKMGYVPNLLGRNLRKEKTDTFYVLLPSIDNPFYSGIVLGIDEEARLTDYKILIGEVFDDIERYKKFAAAAESKTVDGIILISPGIPQAINFFKDIPTVICCESDVSYPFMQVDIDNEQAAFDATCFFINKGKRNIAFVGGDYSSGRLRERGYLRALKAGGIQLNLDMIIKDSYNYQHGCTAAEKLLKISGARPDAVFAVSDVLAMGIINTLLKEGVKVPEDIEVIGFDNLPYAAMHNPSISTVRQPLRELGRTAFMLLYEQVTEEKPWTPASSILKHRLIERDSTGGNIIRAEE